MNNKFHAGDTVIDINHFIQGWFFNGSIAAEGKIPSAVFTQLHQFEYVIAMLFGFIASGTRRSSPTVRIPSLTDALITST